MTEAPPVRRGRIDKRSAMLDAALRVFAEVGFDRATMDTVAREAGVAKPTIYNHFGDKETLLREVVSMVTDEVNAKSLGAVTALPADGASRTDLAGALTGVGYRLVECFVDPRSTAVRRLVAAETVRVPDLLTEAQNAGFEQTVAVLAARFAALDRAGVLDVDDPTVAARQFFALISNELLVMSRKGQDLLTAADTGRVVDAGVVTFLRAFARR